MKKNKKTLKNYKWILAVPIVGVASCSSCVCLTSDISNPSLDPQGNVPKINYQSSITTDTNIVRTSIYFDGSKISRAKVLLFESESEIKLVNTDFPTIFDQKIPLIFSIDKSVEVNKTFHIKLKINYTTSSGTTYDQVTDEIIILYKYEQPEQKDLVICDNPVCTSEVNKFNFRYNFTFYSEPQKDPQTHKYLDIFMEDPQDKIVHYTGWADVTRDPDPMKTLWHASVDVEVTRHDHECSFYNFGLQMTFINSFGIQQKEHFTDLYAHQVFELTPLIPLEYLAIDVHDGKTILQGLEKTVDLDYIKNYSILQVPDGVDEIQLKAFDGPFGSIKKIIIPKTVKTIEQDAFKGCNNLIELDLTSYDDETPIWLKDPQFHFFNDGGPHIGYAWFNTDNARNKYTSLLQQAGLNSYWIACDINIVTPPDIYVTSQGPNNQIILEDIKPEALPDLWYYWLIKIPDGVTEIKSQVWQRFNNSPCYYEGRYDKKSPRRLIFNKEVTKIGAGINDIVGPIYMPFIEDVDIGEGTFHYDGWKYKGYDFSMIEPTNLIFDGCDKLKKIPKKFINVTEAFDPFYPFNIFEDHRLQLPPNLEEIGDHAFSVVNNMMNISIDNFVLPETLKKIGESAFAQICFSGTLSLPLHITNIGQNAFALNTFSSIRIPYRENDSDISIGPHALQTYGDNTIFLRDVTIFPYDWDQPTNGIDYHIPTWMTNKDKDGHIYNMFGTPAGSYSGDIAHATIFYYSGRASTDDLNNSIKYLKENHGLGNFDVQAVPI